MCEDGDYPLYIPVFGILSSLIGDHINYYLVQIILRRRENATDNFFYETIASIDVVLGRPERMFTQIMPDNNHSILYNVLQCTRVPLYKEWRRFLFTQKNLYYSFLLVYTARPYFPCFFILLANGLSVCVCVCSVVSVVSDSL